MAALGVMPATVAVSGDELAREVVYPVSVSEAVRVTWDVTDNSVRVRHRRDGVTVTDLHRESASLLTVVGTAETAEIVLEYGSPGGTGRTRVRVSPDVRIQDVFMRS